jgi:DNA (cytosine-5)-methyltransferase 1
MWPVRYAREDLADFLRFPLTPLSVRAASGFLSRARVSSLTFEDGFLEAIDRHIARMTKLAVA